MDSTNYYNINAEIFFNDTYNIDMSQIYMRFEKYLTGKETILDAGCGSGRDSKYFLSKNYNVVAFDASEEMVKRAQKLTGLNVKHMLFEDICDVCAYDAIWTSASLFHVPKSNIDDIITKLIKAMKIDAVWYMSFKHGDRERKKDIRLFNDYKEETLRSLISKYKQLKIEELWLSDDRRADRDDKWINLIVRKVS